MTIHHIINDYNLSQGGAQRVVIDIHEGSIKAGISSKLLGLSKSPEYVIKNAMSLDCKSPYNPVVIFKLWQYVRKEVRNGDLINVHLFPSVFFISLFKIFKLIPKSTLIFIEHNTTNRRRNNLFGKVIDHISYISYSKIITVSEGTYNALLKYKPQLKNKLLTINNGVNLHFKKAIIRKNKKTVLIVSVGRLHEQKNYFKVLQSLANLNHLNFKYQIAGKGKLKPDLLEEINNLNLQNKVELLDFVPNISELLVKADIFLIPSKWEGFGIAAVEAMNASLPCVASYVPGLKKLFLNDTEDVLFVNPTNITELSEKIELLINDYQLRLKIGQNAFNRSLDFEVNQMISNYLSLYKSLKNNE